MGNDKEQKYINYALDETFEIIKNDLRVDWTIEQRKGNILGTNKRIVTFWKNFDRNYNFLTIRIICQNLFGRLHQESLISHIPINTKLFENFIPITKEDFSDLASDSSIIYSRLVKNNCISQDGIVTLLKDNFNKIKWKINLTDDNKKSIFNKLVKHDEVVVENIIKLFIENKLITEDLRPTAILTDQCKKNNINIAFSEHLKQFKKHKNRIAAKLNDNYNHANSVTVFYWNMLINMKVVDKKGNLLIFKENKLWEINNEQDFSLNYKEFTRQLLQNLNLIKLPEYEEKNYQNDICLYIKNVLTTGFKCYMNLMKCYNKYQKKEALKEQLFIDELKERQVGHNNYCNLIVDEISEEKLLTEIRNSINNAKFRKAILAWLASKNNKILNNDYFITDEDKIIYAKYILETLNKYKYLHENKITDKFLELVNYPLEQEYKIFEENDEIYLSKAICKLLIDIYSQLEKTKARYLKEKYYKQIHLSAPVFDKDLYLNIKYIKKTKKSSQKLDFVYLPYHKPVSFLIKIEQDGELKVSKLKKGDLIAFDCIPELLTKSESSMNDFNIYADKYYLYEEYDMWEKEKINFVLSTLCSFTRKHSDLLEEYQYQNKQLKIWGVFVERTTESLIDNKD